MSTTNDQRQANTDTLSNQLEQRITRGDVQASPEVATVGDDETTVNECESLRTFQVNMYSMNHAMMLRVLLGERAIVAVVSCPP